MNKVIVGLMLVLMSVSARAEWNEFTGSGANGNIKVYYDKAIARNKGNIVRVWQMKNYATPQAVSDKAYLSVKTLLEVNCKTEMFRTLAYSAYSKNKWRGESVLIMNDPTEWERIAPNITDEAMFRFYCSAP